jgi:Na+-transporting methylmalonyl-CoA/oxaloacetate decarboxylase gamma subunit
MAIFLCKEADMSFLSNYFKKSKEEHESGKNLNIVSEREDDEVTAVIAAVVAYMDEDEEVVAAITAAIAVMMGTSNSKFTVRNIMRTPEMDPIWAVAGRMKLMR